MTFPSLKCAPRCVALLVLAAAVLLLLVFSTRIEPTARATSGYYDVMSNCDGTYHNTYYDCISRVSPPSDFEQCRGEASGAYGTCTYNAGLTHELPDFCDSARQEFYSHCLLTYGPEGWSPDLDAYMTCRAVSGIDQCQ